METFIIICLSFAWIYWCMRQLRESDEQAKNYDFGDFE